MMTNGKSANMSFRNLLSKSKKGLHEKRTPSQIPDIGENIYSLKNPYKLKNNFFFWNRNLNSKMRLAYYC